jgi:plastocyanin
VGNAYAPECLEVRRGQTVTFAGDFPAHPLEAVCGVREGLEGETVVNGQVAVTLGEVGLVGYRCREHGTVEGGGMVGLVKVSE